MRNLSMQALWYLGGPWPVYQNPGLGNLKPEPKAMQELVDAGLARFKTDPILGNHWIKVIK